MEARGLLTRSTDGPARLVSATDEGRSAVAAARPAHAAAVRRVLLSAVPESDAATLWTAIGRIGEGRR